MRMKQDSIQLQRHRYALLLSGIALTLLLASQSSIVKGDVNNPNVYPTNSAPYNIPYKQWAEKWWQWNFAVPVKQHPRENYTPAKYASIAW